MKQRPTKRQRKNRGNITLLSESQAWTWNQVSDHWVRAWGGESPPQGSSCCCCWSPCGGTRRWRRQQGVQTAALQNSCTTAWVNSSRWKVVPGWGGGLEGEGVALYQCDDIDRTWESQTSESLVHTTATVAAIDQLVEAERRRQWWGNCVTAIHCVCVSVCKALISRLSVNNHLQLDFSAD